MTGREVLIHLAVTLGGDWDAIMKAVREKREVDPDEVEKTVRSIPAGVSVVTMLDPEYPTCLRQCPKPPVALFLRGDASLLRDSCRRVAYVGSREAKEYSVLKASQICRELSERGVSVVTGLAPGVQSTAARSSAERGIAVLGCGIDQERSDLAEEVAEHGLLVSEYPAGTPATMARMVSRRRIIAALSDIVCVGEVNQGSGELITVGVALNIGRDVLALPQEAPSYSNLLISEGAGVFQSAGDVLEALGYDRDSHIAI